MIARKLRQIEREGEVVERLKAVRRVNGNLGSGRGQYEWGYDEIFVCV